MLVRIFSFFEINQETWSMAWLIRKLVSLCWMNYICSCEKIWLNIIKENSPQSHFCPSYSYSNIEFNFLRNLIGNFLESFRLHPLLKLVLVVSYEHNVCHNSGCISIGLLKDFLITTIPVLLFSRWMRMIKAVFYLYF